MPDSVRTPQQPPLRERIATGIRTAIRVQLGLALGFVLLRGVELFLLTRQHPLPTALTRVIMLSVFDDLMFIGLTTGILLVPFLLLYARRPGAAGTLLIIVDVLIALATLLLDQYFAVTYLPLGADLFGYSISDIVTTASASSGHSVTGILASVLALITLVLLLRFFLKRALPGPIVLTSGGLLLVLACTAPFLLPRAAANASDRDDALIANKIWYLLSSTASNLRICTRAAPTLTQYPFLHADTTADVLGPFFALGNERPNIVVIIVEGLGRSFVGPGATYGGFMPFLDSLSGTSLSWDNFLCTTGRTFGVLPSLTGSLPFGTNGFMELGRRMPRHATLFSVLAQNGYTTAYHYGGDINFDNQGVFLERQKVNVVQDQLSFAGKYAKAAANAEGFSWGYPDGDLFDLALTTGAQRGAGPRLDIFMTLSTHEPFIPPGNDAYCARVDRILEGAEGSDEHKNTIRNYRGVFASLLYADNMIRRFFERAAAGPRFRNTIVLITGDHRLIPVPFEDALVRFHVPLIIASPLLRRTARFPAISSHLDVAPSLLAMLRNRYGVQTPHPAAWLGSGLDTARVFRNLRSLALMRNKNQLLDYVEGDKFLADDRVFTIGTDLSLSPCTTPGVLDTLRSRLLMFKAASEFVCLNDKLYMGEAFAQHVGEEAVEDSLVAALGLQRTDPGQMYQRARTEAFAGRYRVARLICGALLRDQPFHHDARVLLGRTYAWEGAYGTAEPIFRDVLRRAPHYGDAIVALADLDIWQGHYEVALEMIEREEPFNKSNPEIIFRKAKALFYSDKRGDAIAVLNSIRADFPEYPEAKDFRRRYGL